MRSLRNGILITIFVTIAGLTTDYILVRNKDSRVGKAISECGGQFGSIPFWPLGSEYRVTFRGPLTSQQLSKLAELNSLRGSVGVAFVDCEFSEAEVNETFTKLAHCILFQVSGSNSTPLKVGR